jgi:hypothetical protein
VIAVKAKRLKFLKSVDYNSDTENKKGGKRVFELN